MIIRVLISVAILAGFAYLAFRYALNNTDLSQRIKRHGFYGCAHYRHTDVVFGSDFQKKQFESIAQGARQGWFRDNFAQYGKTFEIKQWRKQIFHTCDAANAQAMFATQFNNFGFGNGRKPGMKWLGEGIFTVDGEPWKRARNLLKPIFAKAEISDMSRLDKHLSGLFNELASQNYEVDLQALFLRMYLDYSIDLLFGDEANTVTGDSSKVDADAFIAACDQSLVQVARSSVPWILRWWRGWTKTWDKPFHESQAFVDRQVDAALRSAAADQEKIIDAGPTNIKSSRAPAFVDEMIAQTGSTDRIYLRSQMLNIFFPARDAAGISISFIMFRLARNPEIYAKVRAEVLAARLDDTASMYNAVKGLTYVNAVINETLRLEVPAGHAGREVLADSILPSGGGLDGTQPLFVPKGSTIFAHIHAINRDKSYWGEDADMFRPERWLEGSKSSHRGSWEFIPFLGGERTCPAQSMVLAQLAYIVVRFAQQFREIENRDPEERLIEEHKMLMKIRNGVQVRLVR